MQQHESAKRRPSAPPINLGMMALKFDIDSDPPTLADIETAREQAESGREALQRRLLPFVIGAFASVIALVIFQLTVIVPAVRNPETSPTFLAIVALFLPYMAFLLFIGANNLRHKLIENPRKALKTFIAGLDEATAEELASLETIEADATLRAAIDRYRAKVAAHGRGLLRGELEAIRERAWNSRRT